MIEPRFEYQFVADRHGDTFEGFCHFFEGGLLMSSVYQPVRAWCEEHLGPTDHMSDDLKQYRWVATDRCDAVWIADPDDAILFRLRWC